ncbi:hypothetical protein Misp06_02413 [Microbulbifer sp. NBRC 101763]
MSWPISRVLSRTIIHLGCLSPDTSSDLPALSAGHTYRGPIWSCSERGLPCRGLLPAARCALTAPFHPYLCFRRSHRRSTLCCTFRRLTPPRRYLAFHPMEPGLSSITQGDSDCPASSRRRVMRRQRDCNRQSLITKKSPRLISAASSNCKALSC